MDGLFSIFYNVVFHFICAIPLVYAAIFFRFKKSIHDIYTFIIFLFFSIENIIIFATEINPWFRDIYNNSFMSNPASRTLIFLVVLFSFTNLSIETIDQKAHNRAKYIFYVILAILFVFQLFIPLLPNSALKIFIYYTPCQLYLIALNIYVLRTINKDREKLPVNSYKTSKQLAIVTIIVAIMIIIEDYIVIFHFDQYGTDTIKMFNRSFSENLLTVLLAIFVTVSYSKSIQFLLKNIDVKDYSVDVILGDEEIAPPKDNVTKLDITTLKPNVVESSFSIHSFSKLYEITQREEEILALILEGKNNTKISETLYISPGTVKAHKHNIYYKLSISSSAELKEMYEDYLKGQQ